MKELAWLAGFLEGEGCFSFRQGASISVSQVQKWPLTFAQQNFGGVIYKAKTPLGKPMYRWNLFGAHAVALMFSVFTFMSPNKRAQIKRCVRLWKKQPGRQRHASVRPRHSDGTFV